MTLPRSSDKGKTFPVFQTNRTYSAVKKLSEAFDVAAQHPITTATPITGKRGNQEMEKSPITSGNSPKKRATEALDESSMALLIEIRAMSSKLNDVQQKVNSTFDMAQEIRDEMGLVKGQVTELQTTVKAQAKQIKTLEVENDRLYILAKKQFLVISGIKETERNPGDLHEEIGRLFPRVSS